MYRSIRSQCHISERPNAGSTEKTQIIFYDEDIPISANIHIEDENDPRHCRSLLKKPSGNNYLMDYQDSGNRLLGWCGNGRNFKAGLRCWYVIQVPYWSLLTKLFWYLHQHTVLDFGLWFTDYVWGDLSHWTSILSPTSLILQHTTIWRCHVVRTNQSPHIRHLDFSSSLNYLYQSSYAIKQVTNIKPFSPFSKNLNLYTSSNVS